MEPFDDLAALSPREAGRSSGDVKGILNIDGLVIGFHDPCGERFNCQTFICRKLLWLRSDSSHVCSTRFAWAVDDVGPVSQEGRLCGVSEYEVTAVTSALVRQLCHCLDRLFT